MKKQLKWIIAALAVTAVATPALAEDGIKFYGSVRVKTTYTVDSEGNTAATKDQNTDDAVLTLQNNSRFGVNATTGAIGGKVEMGFKNPENGASNEMYTRLLYGTWKNDAGHTLLVGQNYTPYWTYYNVVAADDDGATGYGNLYDLRTPMISYTMANGLYVAAIENYATRTNLNAKSLLPKLAVGYKTTSGAVTIHTGVAYQQYDLFTGATGEQKDIVVSYLGHIEAVVKGEGMSAQAKLHYGQNLKEFGMSNMDKTYNTNAATANNNTEAYGGIAQLTVGQTCAGFSYTVEDMDATKANKDVLAWVNYTFVPVKGFSIVPEIAYLDKNVNAFDWDGADKIVASVKWQMDF